MQSAWFALVAYLEGDPGQFIREFRGAMAPGEAALRPHLTLLAPRLLQCTDHDAMAAFQRNSFYRIAVQAGEVRTFTPASATIYLELREGFDQLVSLNRQLESGALAGKPDWPYVPHLTLAKLADASAVSRVLEEARRRWRDYQGTRRFSVTTPTLVRESQPGVWIDLASINAAD